MSTGTSLCLVYEILSHDPGARALYKALTVVADNSGHHVRLVAELDSTVAGRF